MASTRGVDPKYVGPGTWTHAHSVAYGMPEVPDQTQKDAFERMITDWTILFPCPTCRGHLKKHLEKHPVRPHLGSRRAMFDYTVDLHNVVNHVLGKPTVSSDVAWERWALISTTEGKCMPGQEEQQQHACESDGQSVLTRIPLPKIDIINGAFACDTAKVTLTAVCAVLFVAVVALTATLIIKTSSSNDSGGKLFNQGARRARIDMRHNRKVTIPDRATVVALGQV